MGNGQPGGRSCSPGGEKIALKPEGRAGVRCGAGRGAVLCLFRLQPACPVPQRRLFAAPWRWSRPGALPAKGGPGEGSCRARLRRSCRPGAVGGVLGPCGGGREESAAQGVPAQRGRSPGSGNRGASGRRDNGAKSCYSASNAAPLAGRQAVATHPCILWQGAPRSVSRGCRALRFLWAAQGFAFLAGNCSTEREGETFAGA